MAVETRERVEYEEKIFKILISPQALEIFDKIKITFLLIVFLNSREDFSIEHFKIIQNLSPEKLILEWKRLYPNNTIPDKEKLSEIYLNLCDDFEDLFPKPGPEYKNNPSWDRQEACNIYSSTLLACLGLQKQISHRVDSLERPIVYIHNSSTGKTDLYAADEEGNLFPPHGSIRELGAGDMRKWLLKHGEKYGCVNVTDLSLEERKKYLQDHIIIGATSIHNFIVTGVVLDKKLEPILSQATDPIMIALFRSDFDLINDEDPTLLEFLFSEKLGEDIFRIVNNRVIRNAFLQDKLLENLRVGYAYNYQIIKPSLHEIERTSDNSGKEVVYFAIKIPI